MSNTSNLKPGQKGTSSGFPATVIRHYSGNMYEVRLPGGLVCIDASDFKPEDPVSKADHSVILQVQFTRKHKPFASDALMLEWITSVLNCNVNHVTASVSIAEVPVVVLGMDGGVIQSEHASGHVRLIILDADTEGCDEDELKEIDGDDVYLIDHPQVEFNPVYVAKIVHEIDHPVA